MEISSAQHQDSIFARSHCTQAMATHLDESLSCPKSDLQQEKKPRPHPEQALKCPRCNSTNTKFCYYNNYSLSQPRYFCKGCRRYWTKGGSLRNVPVGGGCRKNKRSSSSSSPSSSSSSSSKKSQPDQDLTPPPLLPALPFPPLSFDPNDLTLAFANDTTFMLGNPNPNPNPAGFLDILRSPSGSFQSMYYGFGGGGGGGKEAEGAGVGGGDGHLTMFPSFDRGLMSSGANAETMTTTKTTVAGAACIEQSSRKRLMDHEGENNKGVMGMGLHQWPVGGGDHGSLGLDCNGVGSASSWYGLINSSLM